MWMGNDIVKFIANPPHSTMHTRSIAQTSEMLLKKIKKYWSLCPHFSLETSKSSVCAASTDDEVEMTTWRSEKSLSLSCGTVQHTLETVRAVFPILGSCSVGCECRKLNQKWNELRMTLSSILKHTRARYNLDSLSASFWSGSNEF